MVIVPNMLERISSGDDKVKLENINIGECTEDYMKFIDNAKKVYGAIGVICQNIIEASLVGGAVDCMIFPLSVLESQIHREIASEFRGMILLEINRAINKKIVLDFMQSISVRHCFIGVDQYGLLCRKSSVGNTDVGILIEKSEARFLDLNAYKNVYVKNLTSKMNDMETESLSHNSTIKYFIEKI